MLIENNYSIITKKYPLRLRTARKGLIKLFIQKDFTQQCEDTFFFNDKELLNIVYTNVWFAFEGFIDAIHTMFGIDALDENKNPKELAKKLSEVKATVDKADPELINYQHIENISKFKSDRESLNKLVRLINKEVNNSNEFESKRTRNSLNHLPIKEKAIFSEQHESLKNSELAKHQFYASEIMDTHTIYGLNYDKVKRLYDLVDQFIMLFASFIQNHVNDYNLSLYAPSHDSPEKPFLFRLSILHMMLYSPYDEENMLCSGGQSLIQP